MRSQLSIAPLLVVASGLAMGCTKVEQAPIETGSFLTYMITDHSEKYPVTLRFQRNGTTLTMTAEGGPAAMGPQTLDGQGKADTVKVPMNSGPVDIAMLWLPSASRKPGTRTRAGRVHKEQAYERWQVWRVMGEGQAPEVRFYEKNTGILVGWSINRGSLDVGGMLVDSK